MDMPFKPVINYFERPRIYNNEKLDDKNLYLVEIIEKNNIYNNSLTLIYGFILKNLKFKYIIKEYLETTLTHENNIKKTIEKYIILH